MINKKSEEQLRSKLAELEEVLLDDFKLCLVAVYSNEAKQILVMTSPNISESGLRDLGKGIEENISTAILRKQNE